jgi:amino acid permease
METKKILFAFLSLIPNSIVGISIQFSQLDPKIMNNLTIIAIITAVMFFLIVYFGLSWKEKNDEIKEEYEQILILLLKTDRQLFDTYYAQLQHRKHKFTIKEWSFFEQLKEIDRINKITFPSI